MGPQPARASRLAARLDALALVAIVAGATVALSVYALRVGQFQNDEEQYLTLARFVAAHFPHALWQGGIYPRGTQRLDPILLAIPFALWRGPFAFEAAHVLQCLLYSSTALPVFLLARTAGLSRATSLLAAAIAIVAAWAVVGTSFLAEPLAYPAYAWALLAIWLAVERRSLRWDLIAVVTLIVAALARTALLALAPVLPLAIIWRELAWEKGRTWRARLGALPRRLWSGHALVTVVVGLGLLAFVLDEARLLPGSGLNALAGGYGRPHIGSVSVLLSRWRYYLARAAVGTGFVGLSLGLPWTIATLSRPRDGRRRTLAIVCTLGLAAMLLSLLEAGPDERYVMYAAVPIGLTFAAALDDWTPAIRRSIGVALGAIGGLVVVLLLLDAETWPGTTGTYDFFTYPADAFYRRVVLGHVSLLHISGIRPDRIVEIVLVVLVLVWTQAARWRPVALWSSVTLAVALLVYDGAEGIYATRKFTQGVGGRTAAARSWVDRAVPANADVGALSEGLGESSDYFPIWRDTQFWNTSVRIQAFFAQLGLGSLPTPLGSDTRTLVIHNGLLAVERPGGASAGLVPRYLLVPRQGTNPVALDARTVAQSPSLPVDLVRLNDPPRLLWRIAGTTLDGFLVPHQPAEITVYNDAATAPGRSCVSFSLIAPPGFAGSWPFAVREAQRTLVRGAIAAGQTQVVTAGLVASRSGTAPKRLTLTVRGSVRFVNGEVISAKVAYIQIAPCKPG